MRFSLMQLLRSRRTKTIVHRAAWWTVSIVVLAFAWIGFLHVVRGTAVRHVRGVSGNAESLAVGASEFPLVATLLTGAWLAPGNRVEVLQNGDHTYPRLWEDLRSAERSITLQLYYGNPGRMANMLEEILRERAAAGVEVYVLYDAFGTIDIPSDHLAGLRAGGIHVEPFRPIRLSTLHLAQHRAHVRGIVVDGRIGWTGGFGIDDKWFGDGRSNGSWRETNARFEGPAARQLQTAFLAAWVEATGDLLTVPAAFVSHDNGASAAGLLHASPTLGSTAAERFFALSIAGARRSLYITNTYFAPDRNFVDLIAAAGRRGVDVRILAAGPWTDVHIVRAAGRASYETLLTSGVRIYEWQPTNLHAKTFVIDGEWSTVGSMNFDNRSMALNDEATLMILDKAIGQQMEEFFFDDLQHAKEIHLPEFRRRSWIKRLAERAVNFVTRLL